MAPFREVYTDHAEDCMEIRSSAESPNTAVIDFEYNEGGTVAIPAHRLATVVADLYQAAGQPVPEVPHIPDPEQVRDLTLALVTARVAHVGRFGDAVSSERGHEHARLIAADLLAAGWTKVPG